jgi:hypothetical protein
MVLLLEFVVFVLAIGGVIVGALGGIFFAGGAFNRARPRAHRIRRLIYVFLCMCGIVASALAGFVGIGAIVYYAQGGGG